MTPMQIDSKMAVVDKRRGSSLVDVAVRESLDQYYPISRQHHTSIALH